MMLMPFCFFLSFVYFTQIFITIVPAEHWCKLPKTADISMEKLRELAIPLKDHEGVREANHRLPYSRCWMYDVPIEKIIETGHPDDKWPIKRCENWDFNFTKQDVPYSTVATEFQWVSDMLLCYF